jgi:hypothetical protein
MNRLTVSLDNCYGIRRLRAEFDFSSGNVYAIYAPNGVMKSSFAQTFRDVSMDAASKDRIFPTRSSSLSLRTTKSSGIPRRHQHY